MGRGNSEIGFDEVERFALAAEGEEEQPYEADDRPLCSSKLHRWVGSKERPASADRASVMISAYDPSRNASSEVERLCQRCATEETNRHWASGSSVSTVPILKVEPVNVPVSPTVAAQIAAAEAASQAASRGPECRRLRTAGDSGPTCSCSSGACALNQPWPKPVDGGEWVVSISYSEGSGPGGWEEVAAYDTLEAARDHAEIFNTTSSGARAAAHRRRS